MKRLLIIGAGGHGAVVAEAAASQWSDIAFLDDGAEARTVVGYPVIGGIDQLKSLKSDEWEVIVAIGDNRRRKRLGEEIEARGFRLATVVHQSAIVSPTSSIGDGSVLCAGIVINARARIGRACIINTGATVDHDCVVSGGVHISPGANLAGNVSIGECSWIGIGSAIREGTAVGRDVVVGAGSAVVSDIADGLIVGGVPSRELKRR